MNDLISRQALLKQIDIDSGDEPGYYGDTWKFIDTIKSMPPAEHSTNLAEVGTDAISRQDALEAFGLSEKTRKYGGDHSGYDTMMMYEIQDTIEDLPPIQPVSSSEIPNSSDTISRQQAIDALRDEFKRIPTTAIRAMHRIEELPSAQPEIVQCRKCKFASGDSRICMKFGHSPIGELDFCAWAERRTDE